MKKVIKLGHQAPKMMRVNKFNSIEINGDFSYCKSHNFIYNSEEEERKLYDGEACYYTDDRFHDGNYNFYKNTMIHWTRWKDISLKACIRKTLKCRNIPVGTIVDFKKSWFFVGKKINNSFIFKVKKENKFDVDYEINSPRFKRDFKNCERSQKLTENLRANGFIVGVSEGNINFLSNMISNAALHTGKHIEPDEGDGQTAIAYGHGLKIGFSSGDDDFMGYSNGCDNILYESFGNFNKWSDCYEINKTTDIGDIIKTLKGHERRN